MSLTAPRAITADHEVASFDCGNESLNSWLKTRALKNENSGASRTYVLENDGRVVGYNSLATGALAKKAAPSARFRQNMPDPIPIILIGRLAIDKSCQGQKLGAALLKDAVERVRHIATQVGVRGLIVHAISEEAKAFYKHYDFVEGDEDPMTLIMSLA